MKLKVFKILVLGVMPLFMLSACTDRGGILGVRSTPNEFKAYGHAPLVVPEPSAQLPAPQPGTQGRYEVTPQEEAVRALQ